VPLEGHGGDDVSLPIRVDRPASERPPRSLRAVVNAASTGVTVVLLATAGAFAAVTTYLHRASRNLEVAVESVNMSEELQGALINYNRASNRYLRAWTASRPEELTELESRFRRLLAGSQGYIDSPGKTAALAEVRENADRYFSGRRQMESSSPPSPEVQSSAAVSLDGAFLALEELAQINLERARALRAQVARWAGVADALSAAMAFVALVSLTASVAGLRRYAWQPLQGLHAAIARFGEGDKASRATEGGPAELHDIATTFNGMADALARQERNRISFLGSVAHDIRNPLMAMRMTLDRLARSRPPFEDQTVRHAVGLVSRQVSRLERLVADFLDTTAIEAGTFDVRVEPHDLREIVEEAVDLVKSTSPDHRFEVELPTTPVVVECDATRMSQVLFNLVVNAVKYSSPGSSVSVSLGREATGVVIGVSDEGIGIDPADFTRIFEPFNRVEDVRGRFPGVGLGLSVVRGIVQAHGGRVDVESVPGKGSTFRVRLPAHEEHRAAA
jgi:signal transduction histidine kinase